MRGSSGSPARRTASEPAAMMHCSKRMRSAPQAPITSSTFGLTKRPLPRTHLDLALLGEHLESAGELGDDRALPRAQLGAIDRGHAEGDAALGHLLGVLDHLGRVQQRLGGNAADVQAHAAEVLVSARPASPSGRGRRRGMRPCSRPGPEPSTSSCAVRVTLSLARAGAPGLGRGHAHRVTGARRRARGAAGAGCGAAMPRRRGRCPPPARGAR